MDLIFRDRVLEAFVDRLEEIDDDVIPLGPYECALRKMALVSTAIENAMAVQGRQDLATRVRYALGPA